MNLHNEVTYATTLHQLRTMAESLHKEFKKSANTLTNETLAAMYARQLKALEKMGEDFACVQRACATAENKEAAD